MAECPQGQFMAVRVTASHRSYEELPLGRKIMIWNPALAWRPPTDVYECDDAYIIEIEISGLKRDSEGQIRDLDVHVEGRTVHIHGRRDEQCSVKRCRFFQMEIHYGTFECAVEIDRAFNVNAVTATYREGFLTICAPKLPPADAARRIHLSE